MQISLCSTLSGWKPLNYKSKTLKAEEAKEEKLQAWLAIKKRFRGLTLGTVVRISGRLLALMVYEFPDQPGNLRSAASNVLVGLNTLAAITFERDCDYCAGYGGNCAVIDQVVLVGGCPLQSGNPTK